MSLVQWWREVKLHTRLCLTDWEAPEILNYITFAMVGDFAVVSFTMFFIGYTEIDWRAYMQEVEGPLLHGWYDYDDLRGHTGPLVYPGGFVALFSILRYLSDNGNKNSVWKIQKIFGLVHMMTFGLAAFCYMKAKFKTVPPWCFLLVVFSKRLISIYVLRLFNDCWSMFFFWYSVACFMTARWKEGCLTYSMAVSVKTNVLLSAPALFVLLVQAHGLSGAIGHIAICAWVQFLFGAPFLYANYESYLRRCLMGFGDLNQKWSVNWKFLPADVFYSPTFPRVLFALHLVVLAYCATRRWSVGQRLGFKAKSDAVYPPAWRRRVDPSAPAVLNPEHVLVTLVSCNAIGVIFWRSLHFQFLCWYLHSVPLLLWRCKALPLWLKLGCFGLLEYAWSYGLAGGTSTPASSACLQLAHLILLYAIFRAPVPPVLAEDVKGD